jgi:hypothetical protein
MHRTIRSRLAVGTSTNVGPCRTAARASHGSARPGVTVSALFTDPGIPTTCTPDCPIFPTNRPAGYFCLPDGNSTCDPVSGWTVCSYKCVRIPFTKG